MLNEWIPVVLAVLGAGGVGSIVLTGFGKWMKWRRDDKLADLARIDALQMEIKAMLLERIRDADVKRAEGQVSNKLLTEMVVLLRAMQKEREASKGNQP